jgi:hypothetical protein
MSVVLPQTVYRRSKEPRDLPDGLRLRTLEWALYFAVTGKNTAAELGRQMRVDGAERDEALAKLVSLALIEEQELDATEYVRALAASGDREEKTLREFLIGAAPQRIESEPSPRHALRAVRTAAPAFGFKPLPSPQDQKKENRAMSVSRSLSLRALMNLIERQAGSREAGQLDIYRVFVRIDTPLLKRNGIETLRFAEDRLISDPELEQALVRSVKKTLGLDCPENVWVEAAAAL